MLSPAQITAREGRLTASRVGVLMNGDEEKLLNLWRELVGDPAFEPEDFSDYWPVQLGVATEALNLEWFSRKHGPVTRRGEVVLHGDWAACTLDGWSEKYACPVEAKHVGGREPLETIVDRYFPQLIWQMMVTGANQCALSVIFGANAPVVELIKHNGDYARELSARAAAFMLCVRTLTPPVALPAVASPAIPKVEYDYTGRNEWASAAASWLENRIAAKKCVVAERTLKSLVPDDATRVVGHGVVITRNRASHLSLRECK